MLYTVVSVTAAGGDVAVRVSENPRLALEIHALTEIAKTITSPLALPELLDTALHTMIQVLQQADIGAIMLWDQSTGVFRPAAAVGYDVEILKEIGLRAGESITGKAYDEGRIILLAGPADVSGAMADMRPANRRVMVRSLGGEALPQSAVAAPLCVGERKFGVLVLEALDRDSPFGAQDLSFVQTLADLVALAIDRDRLEARADAIREAQQAERMRSQVMATLSHELRLPLSAIKGFATALMLEEVPWSDAKRAEFLRQIVEACDDIEGMIRDMLDSALIEVEQLRLEPQPVRLPVLAREMVQELQHRRKSHRLVVDFPVDFPLVDADPRWIKQVFRNILDNAVKYSPDGGLVVIKGEARASDVAVTIADQGIGIPPENLSSLFEKYFRAKSATDLHVPGTGLGLQTARTIVEAHGGRIWAESKVGEGTSIGFSLPVGKPGTEPRPRQGAAQ
jgi:signal transduction histidine kinase